MPERKRFFPVDVFPYREGFTKVLLDFVQITTPHPPPNLDNLYHFFNAKNVDISDIQNDSLSKILLK